MKSTKKDAEAGQHRLLCAARDVRSLPKGADSSLPLGRATAPALAARRPPKIKALAPRRGWSRSDRVRGVFAFVCAFAFPYSLLTIRYSLPRCGEGARGTTAGEGARQLND